MIHQFHEGGQGVGHDHVTPKRHKPCTFKHARRSSRITRIELFCRGDLLVGLLHHLDQHQVSVSADELLGKGHVRGNAGQLLQRVASHARVGALDALVQVLSTAALRQNAQNEASGGARSRPCLMQTHRCLGQTQNVAVLNVQAVLQHVDRHI